jgi:dihydroorotate dehydrogenase
VIYRLLFDNVLTRIEPERAHVLTVAALRVMHATCAGTLVSRLTRPDPALAVTAFGRRFPSPLGVAAGLDKNAVMVDALGDLGFGHVEVGTITADPQPGNPRPRLFRLPADRALINRMGFNNRGAERAARVLARRPRRDDLVVGVNIGKNKVVPLAEAPESYRRAARVLAPVADYLAVNVSSPNTPGLRELQHVEALRPLLSAIRSVAGDTPVLVKIAPDMADDELVAILRLAAELGLAGVIVTNTTITRDGLTASPEEIARIGAGGLSGRPLHDRSLAVLRLLAAHNDARLPIVSVGGVADAADVWRRLAAGATLVQGFTAFVYEGPRWAARINRGLRRMLRRSRFDSLAELTASAYR